MTTMICERAMNAIELEPRRIRERGRASRSVEMAAVAVRCRVVSQVNPVDHRL